MFDVKVGEEYPPTVAPGRRGLFLSEGTMLFRLSNRTSDNVLGLVDEGNVYISLYPSPLPGQKHPLHLDVWEKSQCEYRLNHPTGKRIYTVTRVE